MKDKFSIYNKILDMIFPKNYKCIFCNNEIFDENVYCTCKECLNKLPKLDGKVCLKCGSKIKSMSDYCIKCKDNVRFFEQAKAPFEYDEPISGIVKKLKTAKARYLAEPMAKYMSECFIKAEWRADYIMCVPMFPAKEKKVGFNHAKLLAQEVSKITNIPFNDNLKKIKNTKKQTEMDFVGRQTNLEDAFKYDGKLDGKNVVVIDDVMTTGATMNTIALELKRKGVNKVYVLTFARTSEDRSKKQK